MLLRERKPYYSYTYTDPNLKEALKNCNEIALKKLMEAAKLAIENLVKKLEETEKSNTKDTMLRVLRLKDVLDETPPKLLPNKVEYEDFLNDRVSSCYLEGLKFIQGKDTDRQIRQFYGLAVNGRSSVDDITRTAYQPFVNNM